MKLVPYFCPEELTEWLRGRVFFARYFRSLGEVLALGRPSNASEVAVTVELKDESKCGLGTFITSPVWQHESSLMYETKDKGLIYENSSVKPFPRIQTWLLEYILLWNISEDTVCNKRTMKYNQGVLFKLCPPIGYDFICWNNGLLKHSTTWMNPRNQQ